MITQKQAYELAVKLVKEGKTYHETALELARKGWVSRKTGKALSTVAIATIICRMKKPDYKPSGITIKKYAAGAGRYRPRQKTNGLTATVSELAGGQPLPPLQIPSLNMGGAMEELIAMSAKFKKTAAALDTLIDAVK